MNLRSFLSILDKMQWAKKPSHATVPLNTLVIESYDGYPVFLSGPATHARLPSVCWTPGHLWRGKSGHSHSRWVHFFYIFCLIDRINCWSKEKVEAERCELYLMVIQVCKELKVALLHRWCVNVKTTRGFINIPLDYFHTYKPRHNTITNYTSNCR